MAEIIFLYDAITIPSNLVGATHDFEAFRRAHMEYWRKYGGQAGLCTYRDAFEYLSSDMREHGLTPLYSSMESFKAVITRKKRG